MDYYKLKVLNHRKLFVTLLIILIVIVGLGYYCFFYDKNKNDFPKEIVLEEEIVEENKPTNKIIYVDIKGYVSKPGVYSFDVADDARINDLIIKAGGLKKDADTSLLNLSKKLDDEMSVIVYSKSEIENYLQTQDELKEKLKVCELNLKNNACLTENIAESTTNLVNINKASKEELMTLSGIGEEKAKDIIAYREKETFKNISDIMNVKGIGETLFAKIKDNITV